MSATSIHLLDVGTQRYGDAILCKVAGRRVLIDGGHRGGQNAKAGYTPLHEQVAELLGSPTPVEIDLLVVSHAHMDHIGCLPEVIGEHIRPRWAYLPSPEIGWPAVQSALWDAPAVAGLREEDLRDLPDDVLEFVLAEARTLRDRYEHMIDSLRSSGTAMVFHGEDTEGLTSEFSDIGLEVLGPDHEHLARTRDLLNGIGGRLVELAEQWGGLMADLGVEYGQAARYRQLVNEGEVELFAEQKRAGALINAQSVVLRFDGGDGKLLFAGDMQFADPEIGDDKIEASVHALWERILAAAPWQFVKLSHHGSANASPSGFVDDVGHGEAVFGICTGSESRDHPDAGILAQLADSDAIWVRTDRNGRSTVTIGSTPEVSRGALNDREPNALAD